MPGAKGSKLKVNRTWEFGGNGNGQDGKVLDYSGKGKGNGTAVTNGKEASAKADEAPLATLNAPDLVGRMIGELHDLDESPTVGGDVLHAVDVDGVEDEVEPLPQTMTNGSAKKPTAQGKAATQPTGYIAILFILTAF